MIERKGSLETLRRDATVAKNCAGVIDEDVNAQFRSGNLRSDPLGFPHQRRAREMGPMAESGRDSLKPSQSSVGARTIPGD